MKYIFIILFSFFTIMHLQSSENNSNVKLIREDQYHFNLFFNIWYCGFIIIDKKIFSDNANIDINYQISESQCHAITSLVRPGSSFLHIIIGSIYNMYNEKEYIQHFINRQEKHLTGPELRLFLFENLLNVNGININLQDINGNTPLMKAVILSKCDLNEFEDDTNLTGPDIESIKANKLIYHEMIKILLERGADLTIKNNNNKCFLDYINIDSEINKIYKEFIKQKFTELNNSLNAALPNMPPDLNKLICEYIY